MSDIAVLFDQLAQTKRPCPCIKTDYGCLPQGCGCVSEHGEPCNTCKDIGTVLGFRKAMWVAGIKTVGCCCATETNLE